METSIQRGPLVSTLVIASLGVAMAGCFSSPQLIRQTAIERAAFDLSCPAGSLTASQLGSTTAVGRTEHSYGAERSVVGVTGCGQKAVYVVECGKQNVCNALLNADTKPDVAPAAK